MRFGKALLVLVLGAGVLFPGNSQATVPAMDLPRLTEEAEAVLYGKVLSLSSHWDQEHRSIYTTVTVQPIQYFKGDLGANPIQFEVPGGVVGDIGLAVSDVPDFEAGEEVVLFLRPEFFRVVGWYQGKLTVKNGKIEGRGLSVEEFGLRIAELAGSPGGAAIRRTDGVVIRRAEVTFPGKPPASSEDRAQPPVRTGDGSAAADVTILNEDFEGTFPSGSWGLIDQNGTGHEWGKDNSKAHGGTYSIWECAAGSSALPPGSNYANGVRTWALYGPFDLSDATAATMDFWMSVQTPDANDYLFYGSSIDGGNFSGFTASGGSGTWTAQSLDLSGRLGESTVWICFMFTSDASGTSRGAFVDDVVITKTVPSGSSPTINSISPSTGPSGTGLSVTISGSNFGATQGGSYVRFTKNPSTPEYVNADVITSWSDTQVICEVPEGASSGNVNVVVGGDPGVGKAFTVTYAAASRWWQNSEPMGEDYVVNPANNDVPAADALDAIINGMQEWNSACGAKFSFTYAGASAATGYNYNGSNEICFGTTGGSLATNYSWFNPSTGAMAESDIVFDDSFVWSAAGEAGKYDIQNVITHELGHTFTLLDLYGSADVGKTMYGYSSKGETDKRSLALEDKQGAQYHYGAETVNITTRDLPDALIPTYYDHFVQAAGGTIPYTFELRAGPGLPTGFTMSTSGEVEGYPQVAGMYYFNVRVTDNVGQKDSQVVRLYIDSASPVLLERFAAAASDEGVLVEWVLASDSEVGEFFVHRSLADPEGYYRVLNEEPVAPADRWGTSFSFLDTDVLPGTVYYYKIESREGNHSEFFGPVSALAGYGSPAVVWLAQNVPNPFTPGTEGGTAIAFSLREPGRAVLRVYDALGRLVAVPFDGPARAGENVVFWDGRDGKGRVVPSGVYFYELIAPGLKSNRKMSIMR